MGQFLTKSRFKVGYDCPTKLFYHDDKEYGNKNVDNAFLKALADGGFQVGELAKLYHPGGTEITTTDKELAAKQTEDLLKRDKVIIYEASFKFENLFVKTDVVIKNGNFVELIEVKSKSFDSSEQDTFYDKRALKKNIYKLISKWEPYIVDIAYQTYVFNKSFPNLKATSYLMLADKNSLSSVDGLNQNFFLQKDDSNKTSVKVTQNLSLDELGNKILIKKNVDSEVRVVWDTVSDGLNFDQLVEHLSSICAKKLFVMPTIERKCKGCEFRIDKAMKAQNLKSGFDECWQKHSNFTKEEVNKPLIFDIWNLHYMKTDKLMRERRYFVEQITEDDIAPKTNDERCGLSGSQRQWLQVDKIQKQDSKPFIDVKGLTQEFKSWTYPLHFIDFETTMVAIPFAKDRRPYEQIAFQFSHHIVSDDGKIVHFDEYINTVKGNFPNFDFLRALKKSLSNDSGTIFRYADHENTVLCQIRRQLQKTKEKVPDREELIAFIESITASPDESSEKWVGKRNMVDLLELVKLYFYHPKTKGSNSLKQVLPAILNESTYLKNKYSNPIYGSSDSLTSKNYRDWSWIEFNEEGLVIDPYKRLPAIFTDLDLETMDSLIVEGSIADGGAAMTAYARMQFTEMTDLECEKVSKALLKYCELDTFAMVMIYEYWKNEMGI